jgi:inhibitor of cysteine peptidase
MSALTEADSNSVKVVLQGEDVRLSLSESPSTGYRWTLWAEPSDAATIVSTRWTAGSAGVGAAGTREFVISVNEPGTVMLHAKLWREWAGEGSAIKRLVFTLQVQ